MQRSTSAESRKPGAFGCAPGTAIASDILLSFSSSLYTQLFNVVQHWTAKSEHCSTWKVATSGRVCNPCRSIQQTQRKITLRAHSTLELHHWNPWKHIINPGLWSYKIRWYVQSIPILQCLHLEPAPLFVYTYQRTYQACYVSWLVWCSMRALLGDHADVTGRSAIMPQWPMAHHMSQSIHMCSLSKTRLQHCHQRFGEILGEADLKCGSQPPCASLCRGISEKPSGTLELGPTFRNFLRVAHCVQNEFQLQNPCGTRPPTTLQVVKEAWMWHRTKCRAHWISTVTRCPGCPTGSSCRSLVHRGPWPTSTLSLNAAMCQVGGTKTQETESNHPGVRLPTVSMLLNKFGHSTIWAANPTPSFKPNSATFPRSCSGCSLDTFWKQETNGCQYRQESKIRPYYLTATWTHNCNPSGWL